MPRFVILEHDHPVLHWDLMLEAGNVLQTWRLAEPPSLGAAIDATPLGDHRIAYLDYEGPVSGKRGAVKRWDAGEFAEEVDSLPTQRRFKLRGKRVAGSCLLQQVSSDHWRFSWYHRS